MRKINKLKKTMHDSKKKTKPPNPSTPWKYDINKSGSPKKKITANFHDMH